MPNTPPEVLGKWRKDYLDYFDSKPSSMNDISAADLEAAFIAGRQTAVIELDLRQYIVDGISTKTVRIDDLIESIESQGYRVEVKGE